MTRNLAVKGAAERPNMNNPTRFNAARVVCATLDTLAQGGELPIICHNGEQSDTIKSNIQTN